MKDSGRSSEAQKINVFVDTNVLLDVLVPREDRQLTLNSGQFLDLSNYGDFRLFVSTLSLGTVFFYLKKLTKEQKKRTLELLLDGINITDTSRDAYEHVWKSGFNDLEDAMQEHCAIQSGCSVIVTNDVKDYATSKLAVMSPAEFLKNYTY